MVLVSSTNDSATALMRTTSTCMIHQFMSSNITLHLQKPFFIVAGNQNLYGRPRNGQMFYEHLLRRSSKAFHMPVFCTVVHNLCERQLMFQKASSTVPISLKQQISDLSLEELGNSVDQFLKGELVNTPANKFLQVQKGPSLGFIAPIFENKWSDKRTS